MNMGDQYQPKIPSRSDGILDLYSGFQSRQEKLLDDDTTRPLDSNVVL